MRKPLQLLRRLPRNPTEAWLRFGARRVRRRLAAVDQWENRRALVRRLAPGRSFLDLGGMFAVAGDVAFWAEEAGATRVLLFDGMDPSAQFVRKHGQRRSQVTYQQGDLHDPLDVDAAGEWEVVWCAGVIYHSPDPYRQLLHLRSMTRDWLLLGSRVIPEVPAIENACIFYPGRSAREQQAFARVHEVPAAQLPGMAAPFDTTPLLGYANTWWGFTPSALRSLVHAAGFEIREEYRYSPLSVDLLAVPGPRPHFIPPLGFSRDRGRATVEAMAPDDRPGWWVVPDAP